MRGRPLAPVVFPIFLVLPSAGDAILRTPT